MDYYYGTDVRQDISKARSCAFNTYAEDSIASAGGNSILPKDVLTMIYANGKGVDRNIDLAIHFACDFPVITVERIRRIEHLMQLKAGQKFKTDFDVSDERGKQRQEAGERIRKLEAEIELVINQLNSNKKKPMTYEEQELVHKTKKEAENYIGHRAYHEIDDYNEPLRSPYIEELDAHNEWIHLFILTVYCTVSEYDKTAFKKADAELNKLFQQLHSNKSLKKPTHIRRVTFKEILETEHLWIKYKTAMEAFGHARCPKINPYSWATILTKQRVRQLQDLISKLE